ncbi:MAG: chemotaxis protein CheW [Deltaproteobacteria bacterium]|nr:chemotaxis protein CheW [Deltaproteobacteria bacterium]
MDGDRLVIELKGLNLGLGTKAVAGIVETEKIPFMPGQSGFIAGIISFRNEPVTVIDIPKAFGAAAGAEGGPHKVVVVKEKNRHLGLDAGSSAVSFLWEEEIKGLSPAQGGGKYIKEFIDVNGRSIGMIDSAALFEEAVRILSTEGSGV